MVKVIALISGGKDSPLATYQIARKGFKVVGLHYENFPYTTEENERRAEKIIKRLDRLLDQKLEVYFVPHGHILTSILKNCPRRLTCVLCRRMMFRVAEEIAKNLGAEGIVTGEALGQHASQTLKNLTVSDSAVEIPILRPLLGYNKNKIVKLGKKLGLFGNGMKTATCCTATPEHPSVQSSLKKVKKVEEKLDIEALIQESVEGMDKDDN